MTRSGAPWAPPITSAREARLIIETVWMPAVQSYDFPVYPRDAAQREMGKENRRKILLPLGEMGIERGSINVAADVRAVARRTGISHNAVAKHLKAEARAKRFIKLKVPGERNAAGGFATIYMLLVDRLRRDGGDDRRGYTTQASQTLNKHIQAEPSKAPPPIAQPPAFGPPPGWQPPVADPQQESIALSLVGPGSPPKADDPITHA
jgi:DNA-binding transcriptional ArsR family regulator